MRPCHSSEPARLLLKGVCGSIPNTPLSLQAEMRQAGYGGDSEISLVFGSLHFAAISDDRRPFPSTVPYWLDFESDISSFSGRAAQIDDAMSSGATFLVDQLAVR